MRHVLGDTTLAWARRALGLLSGRWALPSTRSRRPGQALVESAITSMLSVVTILVVLQLSLVIAQAMGTAHVARSTARWLAVRIDTIDADVVTQANTAATNLPGVGGGGITSVTVTPSCTTLTAGKCTARTNGDAVTVTVTANLARVMFLPTTYGIAPLQFRLPATMPPIAYTVLLE